MNPQALQARWSQFAQRVFLDPSRVDEAFQGLVAAHQRPPRAYHNLEHVQDCLNQLDLYLRVSQEERHADAIELALWYHDSVYEPLSATNERDSAEFMSKYARTLNADAKLINDAYRLIMITRTHAMASTLDERIIADIDCSILAAHPDKYDRYADGIRIEYQIVGDAPYREGRVHFLRSLLDQERLFRTDWAIEQGYEEAARVNINREIEALK